MNYFRKLVFTTLLSLSFLAAPFTFAQNSAGSASPATSSSVAPASATAPAAATRPTTTSASSAGQPIATSSPLVRPAPTQVIQPKALPVGEVIQPPTLVPNPEGDTSTTLPLSILAVSVMLLGALAAYATSQNKKPKAKEDKDKDADRCNDIYSLLEQKKKELEEFITEYPQSKIKEKVTQAVKHELEKNERIKTGIQTAEEIQAGYEKLEKAIEILQAKYNLCMLSLPSAMHAKGVLVIARNQNNEYLLHLRDGNTNRLPNQWALVAGRTEEGDVDVLGTAIREMKEEAGLTLNNPAVFETISKKGTSYAVIEGTVDTQKEQIVLGEGKELKLYTDEGFINHISTLDYSNHHLEALTRYLEKQSG